jgi:hypothetical protein
MPIKYDFGISTLSDWLFFIHKGLILLAFRLYLACFSFASFRFHVNEKIGFNKKDAKQIYFIHNLQ